MATYYANINNGYTGTGHIGTTGDPFSLSDLVTHSTAHPSGNIYNITGLYSTSSGDINLSVKNNTWQGWDLSINGPWRIAQLSSSNIQANQTSLTSLIKDAIFYCASGEIHLSQGDSFPHRTYNTFLNSSSINIWDADIKGCTFYGLLIDGGDDGSTFTDCLVCPMDSGCGSFWIFNNCATVDGNDGYTYNNCQLSWSQPAAPVWNAAQAAFANTALAAGVTTPPEPGAGSPSYTGYETGLWGETRTGIGAVSFNSAPVTNFYADLSLGTDGHSGTTGDPFSWLDLYNHSFNNQSGNTYNIKGIYTYLGLTQLGMSVYNNIWQGWDLSTNGPWRLANLGGSPYGIGINTGTGVIKDAVLYDPNQIEFVINSINTMFISPSVILTSDFESFLGCSIYGALTMNGQEVPLAITDCLIQSINDDGSLDSGSVFLNCAIGSVNSSLATFTACQISWIASTAPAYNASQSSFNNSVLAARVHTPPELGNSPYVGYNTGLWGEARTGIGAVYFNVVPPATNFYVDLSLNVTGATGATDDPFSFTDLTNHSTAHSSGNTYNIKNTYSASVGTISLAIYSNIWQAWDLDDFGPWRIAQIGSGDVDMISTTLSSLLKDAIIFAYNGSIYVSTRVSYTKIRIHNSFLCIKIIPSTAIVLGDNSEYKGCTFYGQIEDQTTLGTSTFDDCLVCNIYDDCGPGPWIFNNCAIADSNIGYTHNHCQVNWPQPPSPEWNDPQSAFDNTVLAAGVSTPPEPGVGSPSYTGYETGLWGEARTGIGAVYFNPLPPHPVFISKLIFEGTGTIQINGDFIINSGICDTNGHDVQVGI